MLKDVKWMIIKSSRVGTTQPYAGITCKAAGVEPGKLYETWFEANKDRNKLNEHNPVGFLVTVCTNVSIDQKG